MAGAEAEDGRESEAEGVPLTDAKVGPRTYLVALLLINLLACFRDFGRVAIA